MAHWDRRELNKLVAESPEEYKKRFPKPFSAMIPEDASSENRLATEAYVAEHSGGRKTIWTGTAEEYAALTPDSDTIYFITP